MNRIDRIIKIPVPKKISDKIQKEKPKFPFYMLNVFNQNVI